MRLWHKDLIEVLPREQLVAQWRELSAIAGSIQKKGTPNHILVNFVLDYDFKHFVSYAYYVRQEMSRRGYKTTNTVWEKIESLLTDKENYLIDFHSIYREKMTPEYLEICYYNLKEKWLCGGINDKDFTLIAIKRNEVLYPL